MIHFGFSYIGLIFLFMLFIPNFLWTKHKPQNYDNYAKNENKFLLCFERTGEALVCCFALIFSDFNLRPLNLWSLWLFLAVLSMIMYECYWLRYFRSRKTMNDFYASFCGVPVAGASLPVAAFFFLGIYGCNVFLLVSVLILGIGHIGIHLAHRAEISAPQKSTLPTRILRAVMLILFALVIALIIAATGIRNFHWIKDSVKSTDGIDEECFIELGGQKQYCLIRGENTSNPIIIWIHGGPASPDTMLTFYFSNYLKKDYTIIAWNQRGCGRTNFKNKAIDPENKTATFEQLQQDLGELVDYARTRFSQDKVIIVGHSFGTMVGCRYAIDHPERTAAYIGVGQMAGDGSDLYAYEDAIKKAAALGDDTTELEHALEAYKNNPILDNLMKLRVLADAYHKVPNSRNYILDALTSPYTGIDDLRWFLIQMNMNKFERLNQSLFEYIEGKSIYDFGTEYKMPVGFISGSCDWVTPVDCTRDYCDKINAPKKSMALIEGWGHSVPQENPKDFAAALKEMLETLTESTPPDASVWVSNPQHE